MDNKSEFSAIMTYRAGMYTLLHTLYKTEITASVLSSLKNAGFPEKSENADLELGYGQIRDYLKDLSNDTEKEVEDLAVDFARIFLAAGINHGEAAFPYESVYTSKKKLVMQEAWEEVKKIYEQSGLAVTNAGADYKEDHIACECEFMAYLATQTRASAHALKLIRQQREFLENHLLNWAGAFCDDILKFASTDLYRGLANVTKGFLALDKEYLESAEAFLEDEWKNERSFKVSYDEMDEILGRLKEHYHIFAPKLFNTGAGYKKEVIKYAQIDSIRDVVYDRQSDYSPKEAYYPVSQTMFFFTEDEVIETSLKDDKGIIVFARPCDINGMNRLDNIFLSNGSKMDMYYARLRERVKIVMLECRTSFDLCFCVSVGTNKTGNYHLAVRFEDNDILVEAKDAELGAYFEGLESSDFKPEFVESNTRVVKIPDINRENLKAVSDLEFWKQFDESCIGCAGCNTVCGTCSCFDTVDIRYNETSNEGERRRVWSGCMLEDFTQTAGGARSRKTQGANMRFKVFHKYYDYKARFGGDEHMCVGCGRCTRQCPEYIDFFKTVCELADEIEKMKEAK